MIIIEKEIEGFENYIICTDGTVHNKKGHNISRWKDNVGYLQVKLSKEGKWYYKRVHRLVAEAFIPNPNRFPCINHKDENKLNNTVANLEWCDVKYNCNYGTSILRCSESRKNNKYSKKVEKVDRQGNIVAIYPSLKECKRNGYNAQIISQLCNQKSGCRYKTHKGYFWRFHKDNVCNEHLLGTNKAF